MRKHWFGLLCLAACDASTEVQPHRPIDGVDEVSEPLSDLTEQCVFNASTHVLALTLNGGDIGVLARAGNGTITINDLACGAATATAVKRIEVSEGTSGDQTFILDYGGGTFATGAAGAAGTTGVAVDLGGQVSGDSFKLIGSSGVDSYVFGAAGLTVNTDNFIDITVSNVEHFVVSLDDSDDTFSAAGNATTGAIFPTAVTVYGGNGNDTLRGGAGDDILNGGAGNDTFTTGAIPDGNDTLNGGNGTDTADYSTRTAAVTISLNDVDDDGGFGETDNVASDIEILKGGMGDDHLTGSAGPDTIFGGPGDDTITGGAGNDILNGDAGNDTFDEGTMASGSDTITGGAGIDTVSYAGRTNQVIVSLDNVAHSGETGENDRIALDVENVIGGGGNDIITGSALDNLLDGGDGNDTISGGAGNDLLRGGAGNDTLHGDAGDDTFDEGASTSGADTISGGAGIDTVTYTARSANLTVVMDGTTGSGELSEGDLIGTDIEILIGGSGADTLTGNAFDNQIEGGPGTAVDTIYGLGGDDVIDGAGGDDILDCGSGEGDVNLDPTTSSAMGCEL